jgi:sulfur carrier protein ThiS
MKVYIESKDENVDMNFKGTVLELLNFLEINFQSVVVVINNKIVDLNSKVINKDKVFILNVVTGG